MGRLVGVQHFFGSKALEEEKADMKELRKAKLSLGDDYKLLGVDDDPVRETQVAIALRIQGQFEGRVLRRTVESKNWMGEKLIQLPPCHLHTILLTLQPFEQEIHSKLTEQMQEEYALFILLI